MISSGHQLMLRLAVLITHPIQYLAPLFRALAKRDDIVLKVFFLWHQGTAETRDPQFDRSFTWDVPLLDGYDHELIPNSAANPGTNHFFGLVNPSAPIRIRAFRPDVLVMHGYHRFTEVEIMAAARLLRIPMLLRADPTLLRRRPPHVALAKRVLVPPWLSQFAGALATGTLNSRYYTHYGMPAERIFTAPFSVDNSFFQSREADARMAARALRSELGIAESEFTAVFAAKLIAHKGCMDLIRAFGSRPRKNAHLIIVGDGPEKDECVKLAHDVAPGRTHFLGFFNQLRMPTAYTLGDVLVLPSLFEPWGLAVNEAMSLGLPIIASDQVGAVPDLVSPDNGWVFPAGNVPALSRVLDEALDNREALARKSEASRQRIAQWDIPQTVEAYLHAAQAVRTAVNQ